MNSTTTKKRASGRRLLPLALPLVLLAACSTADKAKPVVVQSVVQSPGQRSVSVSAEKSGASIVLERAQELIVILPLDPTTGREWTLVDLRPGVLAMQSSTFARALRNTYDDGAGGTSVWRFTPEAAGSVALKFDLRRPRSLDPAVRTVTYTVTIP